MSLVPDGVRWRVSIKRFNGVKSARHNIVDVSRDIPIKLAPLASMETLNLYQSSAGKEMLNLYHTAGKCRWKTVH